LCDTPPGCQHRYPLPVTVHIRAAGVQALFPAADRGIACRQRPASSVGFRTRPCWRCSRWPTSPACRV